MVRDITDTHNIHPMLGQWTYEIGFCDSVRLYMGNLHNDSTIMGWSFGDLSDFSVVDNLVPSSPKKRIAGTVAPPVRRFVQTYSGGDIGPPCPKSRSSMVYLYCGENNTCADIQSGTTCLAGSLNKSFCLCSYGFNTSQGICSGLWFNLLSNNCPPYHSVHPNFPVPVPPPSEVVGTLAGVLVSLIFVCFIGGYIYNYKVHTKRGMEAVPFYDTCTGSSKTQVYSGIPHGI